MGEKGSQCAIYKTTLYYYCRKHRKVPARWLLKKHLLLASKNKPANGAIQIAEFPLLTVK
jgi:hypothetical protein